MDNTLIFFLSDNGACAEWDPWGFDGKSSPRNVLHRGDDLASVGGPDSYISYGSGWANASNTPWRLYKHYGHEGGIRAPLIVHWPRGFEQTGEKRSRPSHLIDIMATCVEVAGADYPKTRKGQSIVPLEGQSLLPTLRGEQPPPRIAGLGTRGESGDSLRPLEAGGAGRQALGAVRHRGRSDRSGEPRRPAAKTRRRTFAPVESLGRALPGVARAGQSALVGRPTRKSVVAFVLQSSATFIPKRPQSLEPPPRED